MTKIEEQIQSIMVDKVNHIRQCPDEAMRNTLCLTEINVVRILEELHNFPRMFSETGRVFGRVNVVDDSTMEISFTDEFIKESMKVLHEQGTI